jgi:hypothetical protein
MITMKGKIYSGLILKTTMGHGIFSSIPSLPAWSFQDVRAG